MPPDLHARMLSDIDEWERAAAARMRG
jgi:hypothetical protein